MGVMRIQPGIFKANLAELDGVIIARKLQLEKAKIAGLDVHVGYLQSTDCIMAFGYPNDSTVLLAFAGKDDRAKVEKVVTSMLEAARSSGKTP